jgi:hypothetical protein
MDGAAMTELTPALERWADALVASLRARRFLNAFEKGICDDVTWEELIDTIAKLTRQRPAVTA